MTIAVDLGRKATKKKTPTEVHQVVVETFGAFTFTSLVSRTCLNVSMHSLINITISKGAKIRNRYNQVQHLTNGKVINSQLDTTNESQEVSPFPAGDHKAHINRRTQRHSKHKTEKKDPQKKYRLETVSKIFYWRASPGLTAPTSPLIPMWTKTHRYLVSMKDP